MARSQNGWPASPNLTRRDLVVNGVAFVGGIVDNDDVETVLRYVLEQVDQRVEPLRNPGCWGFAYRQNRNANDLSNHSSGTAVDANAPEHPNGVPTARTFARTEIDEIHQILSEVSFAVRWGGDYLGTPDSMHFEINTTPERLAVVAQAIRDEQEDIMKDTDWTKLRAIVREEVAAELDQQVPVEKNGTKKQRSLRQMVRELWQRS